MDTVSGAPANVACALIKLGTSSGFIGCVGKDQPGDELVQQSSVWMQVGYSDISRRGKRCTFRIRRSHLCRISSTTQQNLPIHACKRLGCRFSYLKQQIFWSWVHWVGLSASRDSVFHALHLAEQYDVKILLDVNWRPVFWPNPDTARQTIQQLFKQIDFLKLSKKKQNGYLKPLIRERLLIASSRKE